MPIEDPIENTSNDVEISLFGARIGNKEVLSMIAFVPHTISGREWCASLLRCGVSFVLVETNYAGRTIVKVSTEKGTQKWQLPSAQDLPGGKPFLPSLSDDLIQTFLFKEPGPIELGFNNPTGVVIFNALYP